MESFHNQIEKLVLTARNAGEVAFAQRAINAIYELRKMYTSNEEMAVCGDAIAVISNLINGQKPS